MIKNRFKKINTTISEQTRNLSYADSHSGAWLASSTFLKM